MHKLLKTLINNITSLMEKEGLKQADLARKLDWQPQHLNHYLTGKREPGLEKLSEIAQVFGVSVAQLLQENEPPQPRIEKADVSETILNTVHESIQKVMKTEIQSTLNESVEKAFEKIVLSGNTDFSKRNPDLNHVLGLLNSLEKRDLLNIIQIVEDFVSKVQNRNKLRSGSNTAR